MIDSKLKIYQNINKMFTFSVMTKWLREKGQNLPYDWQNV